MSETDGFWKIQASFKSPGGALLNVRGTTPEEVANLINQARAEGNFAEFFGGVSTEAVPAPSLSVVPDDDEEAIQRAEAILSQQSAAPAPQFDPCETCGTPKDQWKPPGISKAGKKYPGFFGCPNFRNHP